MSHGCILMKHDSSTYCVVTIYGQNTRCKRNDLKKPCNSSKDNGTNQYHLGELSEASSVWYCENVTPDLNETPYKHLTEKDPIYLSLDVTTQT